MYGGDPAGDRGEGGHDGVTKLEEGLPVELRQRQKRGAHVGVPSRAGGGGSDATGKY